MNWLSTLYQILTDMIRKNRPVHGCQRMVRSLNDGESVVAISHSEMRADMLERLVPNTGPARDCARSRSRNRE